MNIFATEKAKKIMFVAFKSFVYTFEILISLLEIWPAPGGKRFTFMTLIIRHYLQAL